MDAVRTALQRRWRTHRLRQNLRYRLAAAGVEGPVPMSSICRALADHRGKPIRLVPYKMEVPGPFGLWIKSTRADFIVYQSAGTTLLHQEHIIAHELGHLLADHPSDESDDAVWHALMPDVPPEFIRRALRRRTSYDSEFEQEAETLATVLLETTVRTQLVARPGRSPRARRAQTALGDPVDLL